MSKYPEVVGQLVNAAVDQGMSALSTSQALWLMGQLGCGRYTEAQFPNLTFILDRPHLKQHLYEGAEALDYRRSRVISG